MSTAPKRARCAAEPNAGDEDVSECSLTKAEKASVVELRSDGRPDVPDPWPHPRPVQLMRADSPSTLVDNLLSLPGKSTGPVTPDKPIQIPVPFPSSVVSAYLDCITARNSDSTSFPDEFPFHETVGVCLLAKFMGSDDLVPFLWRHTHDYITSYQLLRWAAYENDNATMIRHAFKTMTTNQDLDISRDILLGVYSSSAQDLPARYRRQIVLRSAVPRRWWTEKDQVDNFIQGCASYRYEDRRWNGRQEEKAYLNV